MKSSPLSAKNSFEVEGKDVVLRLSRQAPGCTFKKKRRASRPPLNSSTSCRTRLLQAFGEGFEQARARRVAQLAQGLGLYLPDALARHVEVLADLFERVLLALRAEAVAEFDDDLLVRTQGREHRVGYSA